MIPITSCRVIDVRPAFLVGPKASPLGPGETVTVSAHGDNGNCTGIPNDAVALSLNVTALDATAPTFLTISAAGIARPIASSLNPSPEAPPTPNAVTTQLSSGGQFNVFNRAGTVNVFIDIVGYYVDHNHDDRYDTTAEVDAKVAAARADAGARVAAQAALGPEQIDFGVFDMEPATSGTNWSPGFGWAHTSSATDECLVFPFEAVAGQQITGSRIVYANSSGASIDVDFRVGGFRTTPGPVTGASLTHSALDDTQSLPVTTGSDLPEVTFSPGPNATLREGFRYAGFVCTRDAIFVLGAQLTLNNP